MTSKNSEEFKNLTLDIVLESNKFAITLFETKKGDKFDLVSFSKLNELLKDVESCEGDFYQKALIILKGLVKKHPFASGNRRTALVCVFYFAFINKKKIYILDESSQSRVLIGIREGYYSDEELLNWLKNGKIRNFERFKS